MSETLKNLVLTSTPVPVTIAGSGSKVVLLREAAVVQPR